MTQDSLSYQGHDKSPTMHRFGPAGDAAANYLAKKAQNRRRSSLCNVELPLESLNVSESDEFHNEDNDLAITDCSPPIQSSLANKNARRRSSFGLRSKDSMVGSYEESLFSGRLSAMATNFFSFSLSMGVLGKGDDCPSKLKLPKHTKMSFQAFSFDWGSSDEAHHHIGNPYIASIDLSNAFDKTGSGKTKGYRIPPTGQLQIIIFNANRTAVQFYLVAYDVSDMETSHKSFVRQRTLAESSLVQGIQFQVIRTKKGKWYIYGDLRLIFQNRDVMSTASRVETTIGDVNRVTSVPSSPQMRLKHPE